MIDNPASAYEIVSYNCGTVNERFLSNHFLMSKRNNPFFERSHKLLLKLWAADGGKTSTEGMHNSLFVTDSLHPHTTKELFIFSTSIDLFKSIICTKFDKVTSASY